MAFVRVKKIAGNRYGYLVENSWTGTGTRQKVGKYLGRVLNPAKVKSETLGEFLKIDDLGKYVRSNDFRAISSDLVMLEMHNHGVKNEDFDIDFESSTVKNKKGKGFVFEFNDGFLCSYTLKRLAGYEPEKDYSGYLLADLITAAGVLPDQEFFVELYGKFRAKTEAAAARKFEFYY